MGPYKIKRTEEFTQDLKTLKRCSPNLLKKIERISEELAVHPRTGIGKPEPLKYHLSGFWSRRLDKKNRIIYQVDDENLEVTLHYCLGHYEDR